MKAVRLPLWYYSQAVEQGEAFQLQNKVGCSAGGIAVAATVGALQEGWGLGWRHGSEFTLQAHFQRTARQLALKAFMVEMVKIGAM